MTERRYTKDHEWISLSADVATIGISNYAQEQLGDVVYVELPEVGRTFNAGAEIAVVESVKAASEIYAPLAGEVVEVNAALDDDPSLVNSAAQEGGWFLKLKLQDPGQVAGLMDQAAYDAFTAGLD